MKRVEIWFSSGLFRAFPHVTKETHNTEEKIMRLTFGGDKDGSGSHLAVIDLSKIDFFEAMEEKEE